MGTGVGMLIEKGLQYTQKDRHEGEGSKEHNRSSGSHH